MPIEVNVVPSMKILEFFLLRIMIVIHIDTPAAKVETVQAWRWIGNVSRIFESWKLRQCHKKLWGVGSLLYRLLEAPRLVPENEPEALADIVGFQKFKFGFGRDIASNMSSPHMIHIHQSGSYEFIGIDLSSYIYIYV